MNKVNDWAFQWKALNPDRRKQAHKVIFSRNSKRPTHLPLVSNNNNVSQTFSQKNVGVILDFKLTFEDHLNNVLATINEVVGLLHKIRNLLPRTTLITIYKTFIRPDLDYGDDLYNQNFSKSLKEKLEYIQDSACLPLTEAIRGKSKKNLSRIGVGVPSRSTLV